MLVFVFSISMFAHAQKSFSKKQRELQETVINMFQALSDRDSMALKSYCFPDATFYEYGQIWNIDTIIRRAITMNRSADFKRINTFDFLDAVTDKSNGWVTYRISSVITRDSRETVTEWLETIVLGIREKKWKVKHLHSTIIKRT